MSAAFKPFDLHGSISLRVSSLALLLCSAIVVALRRMWRGPLCPSWTLAFEIATRFFRAQDASILKAAASGNIARCRAIADSLVFYRPVLNQVRIEQEYRTNGAWFVAPCPGPTIREALDAIGVFAAEHRG
jgi:hypothetical protein